MALNKMKPPGDGNHTKGVTAAAQRLHVVSEIAQSITTSLDLEETLHTAISETRRLLPCKRAAVLLCEAESLRIVSASQDSSTWVGQLLPIVGTATAKAIRERARWSEHDQQDIPSYTDTKLLCKDDPRCLIIPLFYKQKAIGAFFLVTENTFDPDKADREGLVHIGNHLAIAIEHARLFAVEKRRAHQLAAIGEASNEIADALDLPRTLRLVMAKAATTLPLDAGALFQYHSERQAYQVAVSHNLSQDHVEKITFGFEDGVPGWVVKHRTPLIIPDAESDPRVHPFIVEEGVHSVLAVPLVARKRIVGVLNLYRKRASPPFAGEELRLAEMFAAQAAYAIENARLVEELQKSAHELEERVERRTRQLKETQAHIVRTEKLAVAGRLATSVAHEVNNPLQAITLQMQMMAEESADANMLPRLNIVQEELARISKIIQRLLDFQRPEKGKSRPHDVSRLIDEVLSLAGKQLQRSGVRVNLHCAPSLPPVHGSGDQLKQVFLNLILNAAEAMLSGGDLNIKIDCTEDWVQINFIDSGPGMSPEVLARLFEPFFSTKPDGTGLGLAISHEIITQHHGRLAAHSQPGMGSRFELALPVASTANNRT